MASFVQTTLFACLIVAAATSVSAAANVVVSHPALPYADTALEPYISKGTLSFHHGKHHAKYVATTNTMIQGTPYEKLASLEEIILKAHEDNNQGLFNNAAQSWNNAFYWKCMSSPLHKKEGTNKPTGKLLIKIKKSFGSLEEFYTQFATAGNTAFGSGWAWLVYTPETQQLSVEKTIGAGNPMTTPGKIPILCMDVWEHA